MRREFDNTKEETNLSTTENKINSTKRKGSKEMEKKSTNKKKYGKGYKTNSKPNKKGSWRDTRKGGTDKFIDKNNDYSSKILDGGNDIKYWNRSPLYMDATRVPFNRIMGTAVDIDPVSAGAVNYIASSSYTVPGIMACNFTPLLGTVNDSSSPANRAFTSLYGDIYAHTTGAMQFTQASLAFLMCSADSIITNIGYVIRALEASRTYKARNYYSPRLMLMAMGIDPDTVIGHQDELRMRLNDSILNFNSLQVPDFMSVYDRHLELTKFVYTCDSASPDYSQYIIFNPSHYYIFDDLGNELSALEMPHISSAEKADINIVLDIINDQITAWRNSSGAALILGSIQRAYKDHQTFKFPYITGFEVLEEKYAPEINWQVENSIICRLETESLTVTEDVVANNIICHPTISTDADDFSRLMASMPVYLLNSYDGNDDAAFIMEATRFMPVMNPKQLGVITHWGTEVMHSIDLYTRTTPLEGDDKLESADVVTLNSNVIVTNSQFAGGVSNYPGLKQVMALSNFNHAPRIYCFANVTGTYFLQGIIGEVDKYTTVDREDLIGLNFAALQSVYTVDPGKVVATNLI